MYIEAEGAGGVRVRVRGGSGEDERWEGEGEDERWEGEDER